MNVDVPNVQSALEALQGKSLVWRGARGHEGKGSEGKGSSLPFPLLRTRINLGSCELTTDLLALRPHVIAVLGWQGKDKT